MIEAHQFQFSGYNYRIKKVKITLAGKLHTHLTDESLLMLYAEMNQNLLQFG